MRWTSLAHMSLENELTQCLPNLLIFAFDFDVSPAVYAFTPRYLLSSVNSL